MKEPALCFPPGVDVEIIDGEGVLIIEFDGYQVIEGGIAAAIMEAVAAKYCTRNAIHEALGCRYQEAVLNRIISFLIRDGYLIETASTGEKKLTHWAALPWPIASIEEALERQAVCVTTIGQESQKLIETLDLWGIQRAASPALHLVIVNDLADDQLQAFNAARAEDRMPWLLLYLNEGVAAYTLFIPGKTACWKCLKKAYLSAMPRRRGGAPAGENEAWMIPVCEAVARHTISWFMEKTQPELEGSLIVHRSSGKSPESHAIRALRGCCATGPGRPFFEEAMAAIQRSGRRTCDVETTWCALSPLVSALTGIAWNPCQLPSPAEGMGYVSVFQHPIARTQRTLDALRVNTQSRSIGKGQTRRAALLSGLGEAIERYSGIWRPDTPVVRKAYNDLPSRGLHPQDILGYSTGQYAGRKTWNANTTYPMLRVPERYNEGRAIDWVNGWSLTHNEPCFVPATLAFYDHHDKGIGYADSNGCAAGEGVADAILSGLLELIERDAVAIWWYNRVRRPAINLEAIDDAWIRRQPAAHRQLGRSLAVLDISTDFGPAVCAAVSSNGKDWAFGFGCHWELEKAITGALLEASQVISVRIDSDAPVFEGRPEAGELDAFLDPSLKEESKHRRIEDEEKWPPLKSLIANLAAQDLEVVVVDQTHPDTGVPVVRVIVPGLAHHWRRFGTPRLYQAPVKLGWLKKAHKESKLNPFSLVL